MNVCEPDDDIRVLPSAPSTADVTQPTPSGASQAPAVGASLIFSVCSFRARASLSDFYAWCVGLRIVEYPLSSTG